MVSLVLVYCDFMFNLSFSLVGRYIMVMLLHAGSNVMLYLSLLLRLLLLLTTRGNQYVMKTGQ